jgi:hypothetical protein
MAAIGTIGGIVDSVNSVLGFTAVVTAASASLVHYVTVLVDADRRRVERMTAYGFHLGIFAAAVLFALDQVLG